MNFVVSKLNRDFSLFLVACNGDEQKFLESHIGEIIELSLPKYPPRKDLTMETTTNEHTESKLQAAKEAGYNCAFFDGLYVTDFLECKCADCLKAYDAEFQRGLDDVVKREA